MLKKERKIKENRILIIIFILFFPLFSTFGDAVSINLQNALELEKQGKTAQASLIYQEWLKNNSTHPEFYKVLYHFSAIEENPLTILSVLQKYSQFIKNQQQKHLIEKHIALIYELLGDIDHAIYYYKLAFTDLAAWKNDTSLLYPAKLLVAKGLYEQAKEWLYTISGFLLDDISYAEALFLTAKINILLQHKEKALKILLHIKSRFQKSDILAKCLLALIEFYLEQGEKAEAQAIFSELEKDFAHTPEYVLADLIVNGAKNKKILIDFYPLPYRYLETTQLGEESHSAISVQKEAETIPDKTPVQDKYHICVGSYQVYKNANIQLQELSDKGLKAEIIEKEIKGKRYFRVVIKHGYNYEQAQNFIIQLKNSGFKESFLIKE